MNSPFRHLLVLAVALPLGAPLGAQTATPQRFTLAEAITRGRSSGVQAALARLSAQLVDSRQRQRGSDILPAITASSMIARQTVNLREFGLSIPGTPAVTRLIGSRILVSGGHPPKPTRAPAVPANRRSPVVGGLRRKSRVKGSPARLPADEGRLPRGARFARRVAACASSGSTST